MRRYSVNKRKVAAGVRNYRADGMCRSLRCSSPQDTSGLHSHYWKWERTEQGRLYLFHYSSFALVDSEKCAHRTLKRLENNTVKMCLRLRSRSFNLNFHSNWESIAKFATPIKPVELVTGSRWRASESCLKWVSQFRHTVTYIQMHYSVLFLRIWGSKGLSYICVTYKLSP